MGYTGHKGYFSLVPRPFLSLFCRLFHHELPPYVSLTGHPNTDCNLQNCEQKIRYLVMLINTNRLWKERNFEFEVFMQRFSKGIKKSLMPHI